MVRRFVKSIICLFLVIGIDSHASEQIKMSSIKPSIDEMLRYHVDHKAFNQKIAARSFRLFIQNFDPTLIYLLDSEASPYLSPNQTYLNRILEGYQNGVFNEYTGLNKKIAYSIQRSRKIRAMIKTQILKMHDLNLNQVEGRKGHFARSERELVIRHNQLMMGWLTYYAKHSGKKTLDSEERLMVLNFFEKKRRGHEDHYLNTYGADTEGMLALNILKSVAGSLDAHTMYFSPHEASEIRALLLKEIHGVGLRLREGFDGVFVADLLANGPAIRSGEIQVGDRLVEIDDQEIGHDNFKSILRGLEGPEYSTVKLGFHKNESSRYTVELIREKIVLETERVVVEYEPFIDGVIGKIRLNSFYDNNQGISVEKDLREALKELKALGPVYGLVLDMRMNAGGFLNQAVKVAGLFIHKGVVIISKYANDEVHYTRSFDPRTFFDGPLVLLTSKVSASAAEIVAQSLKDEGTAVLLGDPATYGKGSMQYQTITNPDAKHFFKVTVGRYFTISGKSPQIVGVPVDIVVSTKYAPYTIGEKYLTYPLSNETFGSKLNIKDELKRMFQNYETRVSTKWERMIPQLKINSERRLSADKNYQNFLESQDHLLQSGEEPFVRSFGASDIQLEESVAVIKDMIMTDLSDQES